MTGDPEYIKERSQSLVDTFSSLLAQNLKLEDFPYGCTDCETFIRAPLADPEGYLVVEHELSHNLFGTDLALTEAFRDKSVERLLRRAKIVSTHPDAEPYKAKLGTIIHHLWNVLEDHRVRWLWALLYPGGGDLLRQRWEDICKYDYEDAQAERDLLTYLSRRAAGVETDTASDEFKECGKHMIKAKNLVEGVDAESCLAITARLGDDIADELLDKYPPDKTEEAKQKLKALCSSISGSSGDSKGHGDVEDNPIGGKDIAHPPKKKRVTAGQMKRIQKVLTAKIDDELEEMDGISSFAALMQQGAEKMEVRLEEARQAMSAPKMSKEEENEEVLMMACRVAGAQGRFVEPTRKLPKPSRAAGQMKHRLNQVRMKKIRKLREEGDEIDIEAYIDAQLNDELYDGRFFRSTVTEAGFELLILGDVSGSMLGSGMNLLEQAIADTDFACGPPLRVNITMWTFSDIVFFYKKLGSPKGAQGQSHGMTNMVQALDIAYEWAKKAKGTRAVILMTDGLPTSLRGRRSTGNALDDLHAVIQEMRHDGVIMSVLALGPEDHRKYYDQGFGQGKYSLLSTLEGLIKALPKAAQQLVEAHIRKGRL
jgi:hypothetical protein